VPYPWRRSTATSLPFGHTMAKVCRKGREMQQTHGPAVDRAFAEVLDEQISYYQDDIEPHGNGHAAHVKATWLMFHTLKNARMRLLLVKLLTGTRRLKLRRARRSATTYTTNQWRQSSGGHCRVRILTFERSWASASFIADSCQTMRVWQPR
jgi:hypothetical protein